MSTPMTPRKRASGAENAARLGIVVQFLALIRCLAEYFRLKYMAGGAFRPEVAEPFILGAVVAAVFCLLAVLLYFFGRWRGSLVVTILSIASLFVLKFALIG
jgi:hypothetical protein